MNVLERAFERVRERKRLERLAGLVAAPENRTLSPTIVAERAAARRADAKRKRRRKIAHESRRRNR